MIYNINIKKNKKKFWKNKTIFKKTLFQINKSLFKNKSSFNKKNRTKNDVYKHLKFNYILKFIIILLLIIFQPKYFSFLNDIEIDNYGLTLKRKMKEYNKDKNKFAIISRTDCTSCGLFSFYIIHLGCINYYLSKGYIPIVDLQSFKNRYNLGDTSVYNLWELFFYQPNNYTLEEVKKYARNVENFICTVNLVNVSYPHEHLIYNNYSMMNFWHKFAKKYMPIKNNIMNEVKIIMKKLFGNSKNILGVMIRGTDYTKYRPKGHPIQPDIKQVISDVKQFDKEYKYDFIFFATEDEKIRINFLSAFDNKVKIVTKEDFIQIENYNSGINKVLNYMKNYLINIIILSKCLDIITSRTSGSSGVFVLTKGFRHSKVYFLGTY